MCGELLGPNFNHRSWETTFWSLWGRIFVDIESDAKLQDDIRREWRRAKQAFDKLGPQTGALEDKLGEWRWVIEGLSRSIFYAEAEFALEELQEIALEIEQQVESDRLLIEAKKKPPKVKVGKQEKSVDSVGSSTSIDDEEFASFYASNSRFGHSAVTAKKPPRKVKPKKYVPPTPQEIWRDTQRQMATSCSNPIRYGAHPVGQGSVLSRLALAPGEGSVTQVRPDPATDRVRVMTSDQNTYWTSGLSHQQTRDAGTFIVYRQTGTNTFVHVSGRKHPKDPT